MTDNLTDEEMLAVVRAKATKGDLSPRNTSGVNGVSWNAQRHRWEATIMVNKRQKNLGYFDTVEEATDARAAANSEHGFSKDHGRALTPNKSEA